MSEDFEALAQLADTQTDYDRERIKADMAEALELQKIREQLENNLEAIDERLKELTQRSIPEYLDGHQIAAQLLNFEGTQYEVTVADRFEGALPKDPGKRKAAIEYLDQLDASDIVQVELVMKFPRGKAEQARELAERLSDQGFTPELGEGVHPSTLKAFVRAAMLEGDPIEPSRLGVHHMRQAKFKPRTAREVPRK